MAENNVPLPWATGGAKVRLKPGQRPPWYIGPVTATVTDIAAAGPVLEGRTVWPWALFKDVWEPDESAADRSLEQVKGAVLHELRSSGPMGLYLSELEQRIAGMKVAALVELDAEGRVRWPLRPDCPRAALTACQRALDESEGHAARRLRILEETCEARDNALGRALLAENDLGRLLNAFGVASVDAAIGALSTMRGDFRRRTRERDEARAAEEALRRGVERVQQEADLATFRALQEILDGASAEGFHLLERLDALELDVQFTRSVVADVAQALGVPDGHVVEEARSASEKARLWDDIGVSKARLEELREAEDARDRWAGKALEQVRARVDAERFSGAMVGARALSAIGQALEAAQAPADVCSSLLGDATLGGIYYIAWSAKGGENGGHFAGLRAVANHVRRAIGRAVHKLQHHVDGEPSHYVRGLQDAAYVASYGNVDRLPRQTVRIVFQEGTDARILLLRDLGPETDDRVHRFVLGSARFGRIFANSEGRVSSSAQRMPWSPVRIHPDDLKVLLQSDGARDKHEGHGAADASGCQQKKSDSVAAEVNHAS